MSKYARYVSFSEGELEARLKEIGTAAHLVSTVALSLRAAGEVGTGGRSRLIKSHSCPVVFPDGQQGCCTYTRGGPRWHLFRYEYASRAILPVQYQTDPMGNDLVSIEQAAKEKAVSAFADAIKREQKEYFMRSTEGMGRRIRPTCFQMKASRAKQLSGRYALCHKLGARLLPKGGTYSTLDEANQALQEQDSPCTLVVACCNRLDRCWEEPRFNPLRPSPPPETAPVALVASVSTGAAASPVAHTAATLPAEVAVEDVDVEDVDGGDEEDWDYLLPEDDDDEEGDSGC